MYASLYHVLSQGTDDEIDEIIYRRNDLSPDATRICTGILSCHLRAPDKSGTLTEKATTTSGEFTLLVVLPSWKDEDESNCTPIIAANKNERITVAGVMMPFNDLAPHLDADEGAAIAELTAEWIVRKTQQ